MGLPNLHVGGTRTITNGGIVGTSNPGTSVPDGASVNTYGTVTELISAANNTMESHLLEVMVINTLNPSALVGEMSLDILIGGATDTVLISSILCGGSYYGNPRTFRFPVKIPAGVRIAARISAGAAQTSEPRVVVTLHGGTQPPGWPTLSGIDTLGTKASNSRGVALTVAASGGAASVTQIVASTGKSYKWLLPGFQVETDSTITTATMINVGIGIGASTEERLQPTWWFSKNASEVQGGPWPVDGVWGSFPASSRLSLLCSNGGANDTVNGGLIYAGY